MSDGLVVAGGRVLASPGWSERDLVVEGGRVAGAARRTRAPRAARVDATGLLVVPGLVDVQINGGFGHDFTADPASIWRVGARLSRGGVTAFLPTLVSPRAPEVARAIDVLGAGPPEGYAGAVPLGLHLEGPMLSPRRRGVHGAARLRPPTLGVIRGWTVERGVRIVTLAPELPGATAVVRSLVARGVVVAAGHSDATYDQATAAFGRGVRAGTHLFNAMSGLHQREPGLAGALLDATDVRAGIIADGRHVHPRMISMAWRLKGGPAGIMLVSDAAPLAGGVSAAKRERGRERGRDPRRGLRRSAGVAKSEGGVIAGSLVMLPGCLRNLVAFTGCDPGDAALAGSASPAALLGDRDRGTLRQGARADLTLLDDRLRVAGTVVGGELVYDRDGRAAGALSSRRRARPLRA